MSTKRTENTVWSFTNQTLTYYFVHVLLSEPTWTQDRVGLLQQD